MATVVVTAVEKRGDTLTIIGTVDGVAYTAMAWFSHVNTLANNAAKLNYLASQLKAQADLIAPGIQIAITGTVTL